MAWDRPSGNSPSLQHLINVERQNWRGLENQSFLFHFSFISNIYKPEGDLGIDRNGTPAPALRIKCFESGKWFFEHLRESRTNKWKPGLRERWENLNNLCRCLGPFCPPMLHSFHRCDELWRVSRVGNEFEAHWCHSWVNFSSGVAKSLKQVLKCSSQSTWLTGKAMRIKINGVL